jgi:tRNA A-37 threonylcarbamoyl transferase component Bud32
VGAEYRASDSRPKIGDLICGKYQITRVLGRGGMGVVFEAFHRVTEKRFALKWLLPELAESREGRRRFVREAKAASRLRHPGVVEIYDVEQEQGWFFLVMELLLGESLESRLARVGTLSIADGSRLLLPCMRAIARAHEAGIIHRDLKPANLFLCSPTDESLEFAKVLDFGISRMAGDLDTSEVGLTQSGALMGTPNYMAPEQLRASAIDHRTDVYAFGVILYEAFAGQRPFAGVSLGELVLKIMSERPPPLHEVNPDVDLRVSAIVHRALERRPEDRFRSMSEFARALEFWQASPPSLDVPSAGVSSALEPVTRTAQRGKLLASRGAALGLTGASVSLVLVCFVIAWRDFTPSESARTIVQPAMGVSGNQPPGPTTGLPRAEERAVTGAAGAPVGLSVPHDGVGPAPREVAAPAPPGRKNSAANAKSARVEKAQRRMATKRRMRRAPVPTGPDEAPAASTMLNPYRTKAGVAEQAAGQALTPSTSDATHGQQRVGKSGKDEPGELRNASASDISVDDFALDP